MSVLAELATYVGAVLRDAVIEALQTEMDDLWTALVETVNEYLFEEGRPFDIVYDVPAEHWEELVHPRFFRRTQRRMVLGQTDTVRSLAEFHQDYYDYLLPERQQSPMLSLKGIEDFSVPSSNFQFLSVRLNNTCIFSFENPTKNDVEFCIVQLKIRDRRDKGKNRGTLLVLYRSKTHGEHVLGVDYQGVPVRAWKGKHAEWAAELDKRDYDDAGTYWDYLNGTIGTWQPMGDEHKHLEEIGVPEQAELLLSHVWIHYGDLPRLARMLRRKEGLGFPLLSDLRRS